MRRRRRHHHRCCAATASSCRSCTASSTAGWAGRRSGRRTWTLLLTGTLLRGDLDTYGDRFGTDLVESRYHALFRFDGDDLRAPDAAARVSLAARSSASFPFAFEPSFVPIGAAHDPLHPDMATVLDADMSRYVVDGGVLVNHPIEPALRAIFGRSAERDVRRVPALRQPRPGRADRPPPRRPQRPADGRRGAPPGGGSPSRTSRPSDASSRRSPTTTGAPRSSARAATPSSAATTSSSSRLTCGSCSVLAGHATPPPGPSPPCASSGRPRSARARSGWRSRRASRTRSAARVRGSTSAFRPPSTSHRTPTPGRSGSPRSSTRWPRCSTSSAASRRSPASVPVRGPALVTDRSGRAFGRSVLASTPSGAGSSPPGS